MQNNDVMAYIKRRKEELLKDRHSFDIRIAELDLIEANIEKEEWKKREAAKPKEENYPVLSNNKLD